MAKKSLETQLEEARQKLAALEAKQQEAQSAENLKTHAQQEASRTQAEKEAGVSLARNKVFEALLNARFLKDGITVQNVFISANAQGVQISAETEQYLGFAKAGAFNSHSGRFSPPTADQIKAFELKDPKATKELGSIVSYLEKTHGVKCKIEHSSAHKTEVNYDRSGERDVYIGENVYQKTTSSIQLGTEELSQIIGQSVMDAIEGNLQGTHQKAAKKKGTGK